VFERIAGVLAGLRNGSVGTAGPTGGADEGTASVDRDASGRLFRCPSCETVYVAVEKRTCSSCDVEVTRIRSTVTSRPNR
jgi:ribosomal protein L37E